MRYLFAGLLLAGVFAGSPGVSVFAQKLKAEEIVAKHQDSIGAADARSAIKNRLEVGLVTVRFISQKNQAAGRIVLASDSRRNFLGMTLSAGDYTSERFVFDGKQPFVGFAYNGVRSVLGNFVQSNAWIVEESLLGGELAGTWALGEAVKGKLSSDGIKKIDGRDCFVLGYSPKGGGDVEVKLYFDKDTFRHVRTEYKRISSAGIGRSPDESSGFSETRHKIVEEFADHRQTGGLTLPHSYKIHYLVSGQKGTTEIEWAFDLQQFAFNQNLDESTFVTGAK